MNRHTLVLFLFTLAIGSATWWLTNITPTEQDQPRKDGRFPSSYANNLTVTSYNTEGVPHYKLQTPRMFNYDKDETTELEQPKMWQFNPDQAPWVLRGESALITGDGEQVFMPGQVYIDREGVGESVPYHIVTSDLHITTESAYAETDQTIRISSHDHWVNAIGMQGWLRDPVRIKLLNQVRGRYDNL